jgi:signal transduction histidine kinase
MLRGLRVSLANKCQLLFGLAVVIILGAALTVVGWRMQTLVEQGPQRRAQDLAELYLTGQLDFRNQAAATTRLLDATPSEDVSADSADLEQTRRPSAVDPDDAALPEDDADLDAAGVILTRVDADEFAVVQQTNAFLATAIERFRASPDRVEHFEPAQDRDGQTFFRYARALRLPPPDVPAGDPTDMPPSVVEEKAEEFDGQPADGRALEALMASADDLRGVLLIQIRDRDVLLQQALNRIYTIAAWLVAGGLAIVVFWLILTRLILSPVRVLRGYALRVSEGDLSIRSDINTGDEFEQLSDVFNTMLETLKSKQDQLSGVNKTLDLKLVEMAESNIALYEANKMKGEFLANVSHELRTPLNSIIGFAEVLQETLADRTGPIDEKRKRYAANIILSSRRLLELINDLLDLAKIEAGRMDVRVTTVSLRDTCEGLAALISPQAGKKHVRVKLDVPPDLPMVETDAGKLQQILFNFLSNAVKFTPAGGTVTLRAAALAPPEHPDATGHRRARVSLAVTDTGPGIAPDDQPRVFEKFTQLDATVTKTHGGTGLGLTISQELAELLRGRIDLDSQPGRGTTFTLILPVTYYLPDEAVGAPESGHEGPEAETTRETQDDFHEVTTPDASPSVTGVTPSASPTTMQSSWHDPIPDPRTLTPDS